MFDFAWSEMAVIAVVALVVIGPKDLPKVLRTAGQWANKARSMAREFQNSLEEMARETELDQLKKEVDQVTSIDFDREISNTIDPGGEIKKSLEEAQAIASDAPPPAAPEPPATDAPESETPPAPESLPVAAVEPVETVPAGHAVAAEARIVAAEPKIGSRT